MSQDAQDRDFDLQILKRAGRTYIANVLRSPEGEAHGDFELPKETEGLDNLFRGLGHPRSEATRGAQLAEVQEARAFGSRLFETVFAGRIRDVFQRSLGRQRAGGLDLRVRLRLTRVPELLDLP